MPVPVEQGGSAPPNPYAEAEYREEYLSQPCQGDYCRSAWERIGIAIGVVGVLAVTPLAAELGLGFIASGARLTVARLAQLLKSPRVRAKLANWIAKGKSEAEARAKKYLRNVNTDRLIEKIQRAINAVQRCGSELIETLTTRNWGADRVQPVVATLVC